MTEKERAIMMIGSYMDPLRIQAAENKDREVENQLREARAKLEALGVVVENLKIN